MTTRASASAVDLNDVQGIVRFGHGKLTRAAFYLLHVRDAAAARQWLREAPLTSAVIQKSLPVSALHVALTSRGMINLGVSRRIVEEFSPEFVTGMAADDSRSRRLGDVGINAPSHWDWGAGEQTPDVLVMLFATAEQWTTAEAQAFGPVWHQAFSAVACLRAADLDRNEPFGFADGLSQPELDWDRSRPMRKNETDTRISARSASLCSAMPTSTADLPNVRCSIEPRVPIWRRQSTHLTSPISDGTAAISLLRELRQDVRGFWQYLRAHAGSEVAARRLAEAMVGRTMNGEPLALCGGRAIQGIARTPENERLNHFLFSDDPDGERCPLGAHIRRANPRNSDFGGPARGPLSRLIHNLGFGAKGWRDDRVASTRFHRILRRGRKFGPNMTVEEALQPAPPDDPPRGLYFGCVNANIGRQFEFVQNAWLMNAGFEGLRDEADALLGQRTAGTDARPCDTFTIPTAGGAARRLYGLPDFSTVRGGAYFFLPGIRALRYLASTGDTGGS